MLMYSPTYYLMTVIGCQINIFQLKKRREEQREGREKKINGTRGMYFMWHHCDHLLLN